MRKGIHIPELGIPFNIYPLRDEWERQRLEEAAQDAEDVYHKFMRDVMRRRTRQGEKET